MKVDPRLERLQALIEQKRALHAGTGDSRRAVGSSGNPRFAAAAERAREAMIRRGLNVPRRQAYPLPGEGTAGRTHSLVRVGKGEGVTGPAAPSGLPVVTASAAGLSRRSVGVNMQSGPLPPKGSGQSHLGRYIDLYA